MSLRVITELSRAYGANPDFVLAGGGNTSYKDDGHLYVKPSGVSLAAIQEGHFVKLSRAKLRAILELVPPADAAGREALVKKMMFDAVCPGCDGRPSVEAPLHEALPRRYVVHLHPALVNGMTCGQDGKAACAELFPDALWVDYVDPGYTLAKHVHDAVVAHTAKRGSAPDVVVLGNHGVFVAGDTAEAIAAAYDNLMGKLRERYAKAGVSTSLSFSNAAPEGVAELAPVLRSLARDAAGNRATVRSLPAFQVAEGPLTPDHIVYAKSYALVSGSPDAAAFSAFAAAKGYSPLVVAVPGKAVHCCGPNLKDAKTVAALAQDAGLVRQLAAAFGGPKYLDDAHRSFIENWEVESYRKKVGQAGGAGRMAGKVAVVTGAAQGFGYGIAQGLAAQGATVVVADMNLEGAAKAADELVKEHGESRAFAVKVNVADEASVAAMIASVVAECGGLDLFVANAGVLRAGSVKALEKKDWDFVTDINYTGYFLCSKHAAKAMALQNAAGGDWTDIVQVNSKSGLTGSNRNGAYAGSKFGTIGLTQSFALELIDDHIKVNSVCPGNFFDGPLWMDPAKGLFAQYLASGKVPGAKDIADVKKFYESKIPMARGCFPEDVVKAIVYAVEQKYETGQAIPVTGGQVMLN